MAFRYGIGTGFTIRGWTGRTSPFENFRYDGKTVAGWRGGLGRSLLVKAAAVGGGVNATLAATEVGSDTFVADVTVAGAAPRLLVLDATEVGSDTFAAAVDVKVEAVLAVTETGTDTFAAAVDVKVEAVLAATETGSDTFVAAVDVVVEATLAATEVGSDTFSAAVAVAAPSPGIVLGVGGGWKTKKRDDSLVVKLYGVEYEVEDAEQFVVEHEQLLENMVVERLAPPVAKIARRPAGVDYAPVLAELNASLNELFRRVMHEIGREQEEDDEASMMVLF